MKIIKLRSSLTSCIFGDKSIGIFNTKNPNLLIASSRRNMSTSNKPSVKSGGRQNTFYFEPSIFLDSIRHSDEYERLYNKIPAVLILGWAGARDSHVQKYQQVYKDMGYHTIRFAPTDQLTFFQSGKQKPYAYELLDLMSKNLKHNQFMIHTFSNASLFICYHHIINEIRGGRSEKYDFFRTNERGLIVDSGFGRLVGPLALSHGIAGLLESKFKSPLVRYSTAWAIVITWRIYDYMFWGNHYFGKALDVGMRDERLIPTLNLFSIQDKLISATSIAKFFQDRKKLFPELYLKTVVYDDAEHVLLFAKHPEDYLKHVMEHVRYCKLDMKTALGDDFDKFRPKLASKL